MNIYKSRQGAQYFLQKQGEANIFAHSRFFQKFVFVLCTQKTHLKKEGESRNRVFLNITEY